jgi:hypothetical protein
MKYYMALIFIVFVTLVSGQNKTDNYFVTEISSIDEINMTASSLNMLATEYGLITNFSELKVQKVSDHYVLLAKEPAQKWIYAFELKKIDTKLYIDIDKHINACESKMLSLEIFTIKDDEIVGCVKFDHHILGRN